MTIIEIVAISSGIAAPAGAMCIKLIDCFYNKWKTNKNSYDDAQHEFIDDNTAFRKELRNEIKNLKDDQIRLEKQLNLAKQQNLIFEEEIARLRGQNDVLREELSYVRERNIELEKANAQLAQRVLELEQKNI